MLKPLIQVGNSKALVIDKTLLQEAGLQEDAMFQISVNPNGGLIIQSIEPMDDETHKKNVNDVLSTYSNLLKRLMVNSV